MLKTKDKIKRDKKPFSLKHLVFGESTKKIIGTKSNTNAFTRCIQDNRNVAAC